MDSIIREVNGDIKTYFEKIEVIIKNGFPIEYDVIKQMMVELESTSMLADKRNMLDVYGAIELFEYYYKLYNLYKSLTSLLFNEKYINVLERTTSIGTVDVMYRIQKNVKHMVGKVSGFNLNDYTAYDNQIVREYERIIDRIVTGGLCNNMVIYIIKVLYSKGLATERLATYIEAVKQKCLLDESSLVPVPHNYGASLSCSHILMCGGYSMIPVSNFDKRDVIVGQKMVGKYIIVNKIMPDGASYSIRSLLCGEQDKKTFSDAGLSPDLADRLNTIRIHAGKQYDVRMLCGKCGKQLGEGDVDKYVCCMADTSGDLYVLETFDGNMYRHVRSVLDGGVDGKTRFSVVKAMVSGKIASRPVVYNNRVAIVESPQLVGWLDEYASHKNETLDPAQLRMILKKEYVRVFGGEDDRDKFVGSLVDGSLLVGIYRRAIVDRLRIDESLMDVEARVSFVKKVYHVVHQVLNESNAFVIKNEFVAGDDRRGYIERLLDHVFLETDVNKSSAFQSFEKTIKEFVIYKSHM